MAVRYCRVPLHILLSLFVVCFSPAVNAGVGKKSQKKSLKNYIMRNSFLAKINTPKNTQKPVPRKVALKDADKEAWVRGFVRQHGLLSRPGVAESAAVPALVKLAKGSLFANQGSRLFIACEEDEVVSALAPMLQQVATVLDLMDPTPDDFLHLNALTLGILDDDSVSVIIEDIYKTIDEENDKDEDAVLIFITIAAANRIVVGK